MGKGQKVKIIKDNIYGTVITTHHHFIFVQPEGTNNIFCYTENELEII